MSLLEDLLSKDPTRICSASSEIKSLRDEAELSILAKHLRKIKERTKGIELGGAMYPNSAHLEFAIKKIESHVNSNNCICNLYPNDQWFDPRIESESKNVNILETVKLDGGWVDYFICQCTLCSNNFKVEERVGHYTWWAWKNL